MQLVDLIVFFRQGGTFEDFCKAQNLDASSEAIEIYAQEPASLESELAFFPIEETEGCVAFRSEGVQYQNQFDFFYFIDVIGDIRNGKEPNDSELAQKLFIYAVKDA